MILENRLQTCLILSLWASVKTAGTKVAQHLVSFKSFLSILLMVVPESPLLTKISRMVTRWLVATKFSTLLILRGLLPDLPLAALGLSTNTVHPALNWEIYW